MPASGARPMALGALLSSESPDWCTSEEVLEPVRGFAPIRFDPFSNGNSIVGAAECVIPPADSLLMSWPLDGVNWCNPPYGRELARCAAKIAEQARKGAEVLTLVPARTDTRWWRLLAPTVWCAWRGRITFLEEVGAWRSRVAAALSRRGVACDPEHLEPRRWVTATLVANDPAPFPAALCYHGWRPDSFARHFAAFGEIYCSPGAAARRSIGRPKAALPPVPMVLAQLSEGKSIRRIAAELGIPKNRVENVRKLATFRTSLAAHLDERE